jgi:hypothetical protein
MLELVAHEMCLPDARRGESLDRNVAPEEPHSRLSLVAWLPFIGAQTQSPPTFIQSTGLSPEYKYTTSRVALPLSVIGALVALVVIRLFRAAPRGR